MLSPIGLIDEILDAIDSEELPIQNGILQLRLFKLKKKEIKKKAYK